MAQTADVALPEWRWYKGNLHAHTDRSDGRLPPSAVVDWYAGRGYDFLALTDHGRVTRYEPRNSNIMMIAGAEITAYDERAAAFHHLLALFEPERSDVVSRMQVASPQRTLDELVGAGATVIHAHPYWLGLTSAETGSLQGAIGVEVFNNVCQVERAKGYSEQHWDELLLRGKRMWGLAVDDCHWRGLDAGGGWVMVRARELSQVEIIRAIRRGDFYSTQGPEIKRFAIERDTETPMVPNGRLQVAFECSPCRKIVFYADRWLGAVVEAGGDGAIPITEARYVLTGKETYVRAVCIDYAGRTAWANPIFPEQGARPGYGSR